MPEALLKNHSPSDEAGLWFQNRGLFSDHFLKARLPQWKEWEIDEELATFRKELMSLYESTKPILPTLNEAQTEKEFIQPLLDLLGYANSYIVQAPTKVGQQTNRPDYALFPDGTTKNKAYQKLKGNDYTQCIGIADAKYWERELDLTKSSDRDTYTNQNPSFQIVSYLTGTQQKWGILTNGRLWRLYCIKSHLPLGNYYQVDLVKLLEEAPEEKLKYLYLFFRKAALVQTDGKSFLDHVLEGSNEYAVELEADIKERAYEVVELLCRGFAAGFSKKQLAELALKDIFDNSLTLLYRLLFVFYAEARELLPLTSSLSYYDNYSMHKITHDIDEVIRKGQPLSSQSTIYYQRISNLFGLINTGDPDLGVPEYNGGLFDPEEHPFLEEQAIADTHLVPAIQQLAQVYDKELKRVVTVDYNTLSERHLGSIYEGLLEFKPRLAPYDLVTTKEKGSIKYAPASEYSGKKIAYKKNELYLADDKGERKASGSYYTPEYIVNYIVENTLDPLVKEAQNKLKALKPEVDKATAKWQKLKEQKQGLEPTDKYDRKTAEERERLLEPYLSLKVLDPAMGSGHFLARTTDFLAEAIATDPSIESPVELTEESELTYYRRRVVESCIYGVDLNPLAVELAKLTLWLGTMAKSKPLSFLNHHLRTGNSLIGAKVADLDEIPKRKGKRGKPFDTSRAPVQLGIFQQVFNQKLYDLLQNRALIAQLPTETLEDIHNKQKWERDFEHSAERFHTLADLWVSTYFGNDVRWDEYNTLVENLHSPEPEWGKLLKKEYIKRALAMREVKHFFHWELEFPEVFYDEHGNRKANPGFEAVVGNPPWVSFSGRQSLKHVDQELSYYRIWYHGAKAWVSTHGLFVETGLNLIHTLGYVGLILPLQVADLRGYAPLRALVLKRCSPRLPIPSVGENAFLGVTEPAGLFIFGPHKSSSSLFAVAAQNAWPSVELSQPKQATLKETTILTEIMQKYSRWPLLPAAIFSDPGVHTGNSADLLLSNQPDHPGHWFPIREGKCVERYWLGEPERYLRLNLQKSGGQYWRISPVDTYKDVAIVIRQTAHFPIAALHEPSAYFRNSLLACRSIPSMDIGYLVAILNSSLTKWVHQRIFRDSQHRAFPQVKVYHLQAIRAPQEPSVNLSSDDQLLFEQLLRQYEDWIHKEHIVEDG